MAEVLLATPLGSAAKRMGNPAPVTFTLDFGASADIALEAVRPAAPRPLRGTEAPSPAGIAGFRHTSAPKGAAAERRRTFLLVRYVVIVAVAALAMAHAHASLPLGSALVILAALVSNAALGWVNPRHFFRWQVQGPVLLMDTLWIGLVLLAAGLGQQFFLFYFIELFLAAISESFALLAVGAALVAAVNVALGSHAAMTSASLIRLPFFFATAIFYGYVIDTTKRQRRLATQRAEWARQLENEVQVRTEELQRQSAELQSLYERVVETDRLKSEFVANMSHELRTPLNAIIGYTEVALDDPTLSATCDLRTFLKRIAAGARGLHRLLESLLRYAALDRGQRVLLVKRFALDTLLDDLRDLCNDICDNPAVVITVQRAAEVELETDFDRLHSVLSNLLLNALKFTHRGQVELAAHTVADEVRFTIRDTGVGIPAAELDRIFEPFRQVDGSATRSFGGIGLGLAIVRRNLAFLRGRVDVESCVGVGSTFRVSIPQRLEAPATPKGIS